MICFRSRISSWWLVPSAFPSDRQDKRVACQEEAVGLQRYDEYDEHVDRADLLVFDHCQQIVGDGPLLGRATLNFNSLTGLRIPA
jgi:hypothetical protein